MSDRMNADMKTWVDAAISTHLRDAMPLEGLQAHFIGSLLAQMLLYYRYDVPDKWQRAFNNADLLGLGKRLADSPGLVRYCTISAPSISNYDEIYEALDADCWSGYEQLPPAVWHILREISGLAKADWESLPGLVEKTLTKTIVCTRCGYADDLHGFGEVTEYADPFTFSGGTRIHLRCKRCGERVTFESEVMQVEKYKKKYIDARIVIIATGIITLLLIGYGLFRNVL